MQPADYARIEKAILYLEKNFRRQPGLGEVARTAGLSEYHFHRLFTRWAGISPKRFLQFLSAGRADEALRDLRNRWGRATLRENPRATKAIADRIFDPSQWKNDPPLAVFVQGTNFQVKVWEALVRIPPGCAVTYENIAVGGGSPRAVRAVGSARA